jgi:hypothetical protein
LLRWSQVEAADQRRRSRVRDATSLRADAGSAPSIQEELLADLDEEVD